MLHNIFFWTIFSILNTIMLNIGHRGYIKKFFVSLPFPPLPVPPCSLPLHSPPSCPSPFSLSSPSWGSGGRISSESPPSHLRKMLPFSAILHIFASSQQLSSVHFLSTKTDTIMLAYFILIQNFSIVTHVSVAWCRGLVCMSVDKDAHSFRLNGIKFKGNQGTKLINTQCDNDAWLFGWALKSNFTFSDSKLRIFAFELHILVELHATITPWVQVVDCSVHAASLGINCRNDQYLYSRSRIQFAVCLCYVYW